MTKKRKPDQTLKIKDLEIMQSQEVEHKEYTETMAELGVTRNAIADAKKKPAYRELVIAALAEKQVTVDTFAQNLKDLMEAKKQINVHDEGLIEVNDNTARVAATMKFGDILGVDAPKEFDLKHSMAAMSDDELRDAVDDSVKELDGRIQNRVTGTPSAKAAVTNTVVAKEPAVAKRS